MSSEVSVPAHHAALAFSSPFELLNFNIIIAYFRLFFKTTSIIDVVMASVSSEVMFCCQFIYDIFFSRETCFLNCNLREMEIWNPACSLIIKNQKCR